MIRKVDRRDPLRRPRGIANGIAIALMFWGLLLALVSIGIVVVGKLGWL